MSDERAKCPICGAKLGSVTYPSDSMLNRDQWESVRAGDWYCTVCPPNNRGNRPLCYWWEREVRAPELVQANARLLSEVARLEGALTQYADQANWAYIGDQPGNSHGDWRWHFSIGPDDEPWGNAAAALSPSLLRPQEDEGVSLRDRAMETLERE